MSIIDPVRQPPVNPDANLRIVGYDPATMDAEPGHAGKVSLDFYLSRELNRYELYVAEEFYVNDTDDEVPDLRDAGDRFRYRVVPNKMSWTISHLNQLLQAIESRGADVERECTVALQNANDALDGITF